VRLISKSMCGGASEPFAGRGPSRAPLLWLPRLPVACAVLLGLISLAGSAAAQGKPEGTMTWALHFSLAPTYFDPAETTGIATPFKFLYALHDALIKPMPQGLLTPSLAETWTESPDGLVYEFKLREGVAFHNGEPLTAADVAYTLPGELAEEVRRDPQLTLKVTYPPTPFWLDFTTKWDAKSPWHDRRVRLAANYAIDRQAINEAETLGFSKLTGSIVPHTFPYALPLEPYPYDAERARHLLKEAGYPQGFDAGDIIPVPPWTAMAEAVAGYLGAVGIKVRVRSLERPAMFAAWRAKTLQGVILAASGAIGSASTRLENYVVSWGEFAYGGDLGLDDRFKQQARERDPQRCQALLHDLQRQVHERVMFAPIYEIAGLNGVGPHVAESGLGLIPTYNWSGPYEDVRLKR
jgi:ABC-type transport system substrate-binding protein